MTDLQPYITAAYRASTGHAPDPAFVDFIAAFRGNPDLVAAARDEAKRLDDHSPQRGRLAENDYESRIRHQTLARMLAEFDALEPTP